MKPFVQTLLAGEPDEFIDDWRWRAALQLEEWILQEHAAGRMSADFAADAICGNGAEALDAVANNTKMFREWMKPDEHGDNKFDAARAVYSGYNRNNESTAALEKRYAAALDECRAVRAD